MLKNICIYLCPLAGSEYLKNGNCRLPVGAQIRLLSSPLPDDVLSHLPGAGAPAAPTLPAQHREAEALHQGASMALQSLSMPSTMSVLVWCSRAEALSFIQLSTRPSFSSLLKGMSWMLLSLRSVRLDSSQILDLCPASSLNTASHQRWSLSLTPTHHVVTR